MVQERLSGNASEKTELMVQRTRTGQHEGRAEKGSFPEQENIESESPASGEGYPSTRGL